MPGRESRDQGDAAPPPTLRSQHVEATRRAILSAARASFGAKGYAQTSIDEIAAAARAAGALDPEAAPIDQLVATIDAYLEVALDQEVRQITLIDGPVVLGLEPEGPADQTPGYLALRAFIADAIGRGELRDFDPGVLAHLVGGLALMGGLTIARAGDPKRTRATVGQAIELMLRGLGPDDP